MSAPEGLDQIRADKQNLYREEVYTDLKVASLRRLVPIKPDGSEDSARDPIWVASTNVMSTHGPLPVSAPIEGARTLEEALDGFPEAVQQGVERLIEEAREYQRQEASRIVVPGRDIPPGGPGPGKLF